MQKNRIEKSSFLEWDNLRIKRDEIPIGLHGEGENSNLIDREP